MIAIEPSLPNIALILLQMLLPILSILTSIYFLCIFLSSPRRVVRPVPQEPPATRFLVIIAARNESPVIAKSLKSLRSIRYPRELLDVVVVADNCTDNTADIARQYGAQVLERHDLSRQSKASALGWAFKDQKLLERDYDAITLLDADNLIDPDYFLHVDRKLREGAIIVQGRRQASNAAASGIAAVLSIIYSFENRLWYLPHANRNRSTMMYGTGATIRRDHLQRIGWNIRTLVEDAEFSIQSILAGANILYCDEAVVHVMIPTTVLASWQQLRRWFSGQIHCGRIHLPAIWRKVRQDRGGTAVVLLITMIIPFNCTMGLVQLFLGPITAIQLLGGQVQIAAILLGLLVNHIVVMFGAILILLLDNRLHPRLWKGIALFPLLHPFYGFVYLVSYFCPEKTWKLMNHA